MSKFYMTHKSDSRQQVTRCGHKVMTTHCSSWNHGISVEIFVNEAGNNEFRVYETGGSNNDQSENLIYEYEEV